MEPQALGHLLVEEAFRRAVGLDPVTIDHKLRDGALAGALNDFIIAAEWSRHQPLCSVCLAKNGFSLTAVRSSREITVSSMN